MEKKIHIYYINRIKSNLGRIFEAEDTYCFTEEDQHIVVANNRAIEHWLKKAGITDPELKQEILSNVDWCWDGCKERLEGLGWTVLTGKENI